jgi:hypothetical protein
LTRYPCDILLTKKVRHVGFHITLINPGGSFHGRLAMSLGQMDCRQEGRGEMLGVLTNSYKKNLQIDMACMWHFIN